MKQKLALALTSLLALAPIADAACFNYWAASYNIGPHGNQYGTGTYSFNGWLGSVYAAAWSTDGIKRSVHVQSWFKVGGLFQPGGVDRTTNCTFDSCAWTDQDICPYGTLFLNDGMYAYTTWGSNYQTFGEIFKQ